MKVRLRRVGVGSLFLLALVIYAAAGLVVGGLVAAATSLPLPEGYELTVLDRLGPWALAIFPALYGIVGGILAVLAGVLYNIAAAVTGGVKLELPGLEPGGGAGAPGTRGESPQAGAAEAAAESEAGEPSSADGEEDDPESSRSSGE